jgi:AraC family transcriptional regulator
MSMNSLSTSLTNSSPPSPNIRGLPPKGAVLLAMNRPGRLGYSTADASGRRSVSPDCPAFVNAGPATVNASPAEFVKRRMWAWPGMRAEIIQPTNCERIDYRYCGPLHLLAVYDEVVRVDGETSVEGLPRSCLHDLRKKFTFVPAGHPYREWHTPRTPSRVGYFFFDPERMPIQAQTLCDALAPRLHFEDAPLWDTVRKLMTALGNAVAGEDNEPYLEALGVVLAHELTRLDTRSSRTGPPMRGGLAAWQQRIVTAYIEEHLAEQVPLATLAQLVRLSPFYFCRAFKQSFGMPPHRYHINRRIDHAKTLLAKPDPSVTEIGLAVGFSETSSFTASFRKVTGLTPTSYHRSLC